MPVGISDARLRFLETAPDDLAVIRSLDKLLNRVAGGSYLHFCWDWDGLVIDSTDDEFKACSCFADEVDEKQIKAQW